MIECMNEEGTGKDVSADEKMTWKKKAWETTRVFVFPIVIVLLIRFYIVQPFIVKGVSMEPMFEDQEYLIIDEITPVFRPIERGTVIIFRYPLGPSEFFIKRVIGLPGERVTVKNGEVTVKKTDGTVTTLDESYLARGTVTAGAIEIDVPSDQYFVLGDNRNYSSDSRKWGLLSKEFVTGRAVVRLWPPERIGIIKKANY